VPHATPWAANTAIYNRYPHTMAPMNNGPIRIDVAVPEALEGAADANSPLDHPQIRSLVQVAVTRAGLNPGSARYRGRSYSSSGYTLHIDAEH